ncbi:PTS system sorbose subfamily IIB component [Erysipelotrichaceae bacterium 3_1_53]|nr:PTS system sorbose subfamily IIB component [Erysipelotrichaceae bacterium 3_1_53]
MIIDDETYHDAFIRSFITMVVPRGIQIQVLDTKSGISFLQDYQGPGLVLLAKYPQTFYLLMEGGIEFREIIIGGMGARENRKVLYKNICASDEELDVLKKLYKSGISVKIQIVPEEKGIPLETLL